MRATARETTGGGRMRVWLAVIGAVATFALAQPAAPRAADVGVSGIELAHGKAQKVDKVDKKATNKNATKKKAAMPASAQPSARRS